MSEQILARLKRKFDELAAYGGVDAETSRNVLKEELQLYVLNFIYHHPKYSKWIMYGGSAFRIIHGLDRMSVDLDFEISEPVTKELLEEFKKEIEDHFTNSYGAGTDFLTVKIANSRGLTLKFHVGEEMSFGQPSKQVHAKIDLNQFVVPNTLTERRPINRDQLSFVITTYNMGSLMASKIAAIFLRGIRGVGKATYEEKGRDVYDFLWYMNKKVVPDFDYLIAKGIDVRDLRALFDKLTLRMNKVSDENLKQDLLPLFTNRTFIENWLKNWRESYLQLLDDYKMTTVTTLAKIQWDDNLRNHTLIPRNRTLTSTFTYNTEDNKSVHIRYVVSEDWVLFHGGDLTIEPDQILSGKTEFPSDRWSMTHATKDIFNRYTTLFDQKTERYFKKTNRTMLGNEIVTKVIRMTADKFNQKEEIVLTKSALLSCELDDLLK